jgi:hypothetical protein
MPRCSSAALGRVFQGICCQFFVRYRLVQPRTAEMVAEFGPEPHAEQYLDWKIVLSNELERGQ